MNSTSQTLAQRIANGRISVPEGLQLAMAMAEQLRILHDSGSAHGGLTPTTVAISGSSVQLLPPQRETAAYDAPELRAGSGPDARSDIFSFGAIVFEMLTAQAAFDGEITAGPLECGSAPIDRLVNGCIAASPDSRYQRMAKVILELRLLLANARRGNVAAPAQIARPVRPAMTAAPTLPTPVVGRTAAAPDVSAMQAMQDLEGRISARLQDQEKTIANVAHVANEVLKALREQQAVAVAAPAPPPMPRYEAPMERPEPVSTRGMGFRGYEELHSGGSRADKMMDLLSDKLSRLDMVVCTAVDRLQKLEDIFDQFDTDAAALRDSVTRDIRKFEHALKSQGAAIESARTAMGQTDDLVERVVEAIDSLQSMFVTAAEERTLAS
jgi:eukaryotic-like serine/threonine-protein kinase